MIFYGPTNVVELGRDLRNTGVFALFSMRGPLSVPYELALSAIVRIFKTINIYTVVWHSVCYNKSTFTYGNKYTQVIQLKSVAICLCSSFSSVTLQTLTCSFGLHRGFTSVLQV